MSAIYWEKNVDAQVYAPYILFYAPSTTAPANALGVWLVVPNTEQPIYWLDLADVYATGEIRPIWSEGTAGASVSAIVRARSIMRFVFGRIFGRIN